MAVERESKTQERAIRLFRKYGAYVYKNAQNIYTEKGRPDLTACLPVSIKTLIDLFGEDASVGLFVGVEMKRPGELDTVSDAQEIVGRKIKKAKGVWLPIDDTVLLEAFLVKLTNQIKTSEK